MAPEKDKLGFDGVEVGISFKGKSKFVASYASSNKSIFCWL